MDDFNPQTEKLLARSVEQYRELYQHADTLRNLLNDCDYPLLQTYVARLLRLQAAASQQDEQLLPLLKRDLPAWEGHKLYRQRRDLINAILELNTLLLPKIRGIMAVTAAELDQLRSGRTALAGYAAPTVDQRGLRGVG